MSATVTQQPTHRPTPSDRSAAAPNPQDAIQAATPKDHLRPASNDRRAKNDPIPTRGARGGSDSDQAIMTPAPRLGAPDRSNSQSPIDQPAPMGTVATAPNVPERQSHLRAVPQSGRALLLWDPVLQTLADGLDDIESTRIAQANRYRILTTATADSDGETRGFGLSEDHPAVAALKAQLGTLEFLDKQMTKALRTQLKAHPLYPWIKAQKGLGDKTVARLLAAIRDPYWNDLHDRPRTIGELFAFCGVAGPGQRRTRGQRSNWNPDARKRLWIMTGPIIRGDGPYRAVYDAGRARYADKTHTAPCAQCGVKGKPAETGSPWRDGHKHAGAIRLVMREILRDLWTEARAYYEHDGSKAVAS